jgi:hypothetical protein
MGQDVAELTDLWAELTVYGPGSILAHRQSTFEDIFYCCNDPCLARIIAAVKNIDAPMLTRVRQELEYRIDVCRVTRGAHIEHL